MAEDITTTAVEAGTKAVMDLSLSAGAFSISLKIDNAWLAGAVSVGALSLGAFYLACKGPAEEAIRRALQRKIFGVEDPKVTKIADGHSVLVEVICNTETSFLVFLEDFEMKTVKFRLEDEFKKICFNKELDVNIRNEEAVYEQAKQIRKRSGEQREFNEHMTWRRKYEELARMVNKMYEKQSPESLLKDTQTVAGPDETLNRIKQLKTFFSGPENLKEELKCLKEELQREKAISKGLRRTNERLQEESKGVVKPTECKKDGEREIRKEEIRLRMQNDVLELREKVHELEKANESLQQKLKKKDKELERFQSLEIDDVIPESRPRASSGTSLGASSGYQSEEDPDESTLEIIQMPRSQAIQEGKKLVLSCRTRRLPDIRYRWVKDDIEIPGANRPDLVLEPVRMRDFGRYVCRVWDKSGAVTSDSADIDVFPAPNMRFRGLHEIDAHTKQAIIDLLSKKRLPGLAPWKQVARRFAMRETEISSLEMERTPAGVMFERLTCLAPNLTVYYLCKTFKESGLKRLDVVDLISKHMVISA